jgi:hypothetical protein
MNRIIILVVGIFVLLLVSCGNGRHRKQNNGKGHNSNVYSETPYEDDYSEQTPQNRQNKSSSKPNVQQMKLDLVEKTIVEPTHKLYRKEFKIRSANNVQHVEIIGTEDNGNQIIYTTHLKLSDEINTYLADINITYVLSNKEWTIQYLESKSLDIVPTGKFDNCIVVKKERCSWSLDCPFFFNNCDVQLLIEGIKHSSYGGDWKDFALLVPANGSMLFDYDENIDYKITRIERP